MMRERLVLDQCPEDVEALSMQPIDPHWSFADAIEGAWQSYVGSGIESKGRRNAYLKAWGNVVGRERAVESFDGFVSTNGGHTQSAQALALNVRTFKELRAYFQRLPSRTAKPVPAASDFRPLLNTPFPAEEDRRCEFKELRGNDPAASIRNNADEYAVSFLNSEGGRILWGIRDEDRVVVGVILSDRQKDEIRRDVANKLHAIRPPIATTSTRITFHPVYDGETILSARYVVELAVPRGDPQTLYFTGGDEAFVRVDGAKHKLRGPAIQAWIMERVSPKKATENAKAIYSEVVAHFIREQQEAEQRRIAAERRAREEDAIVKVETPAPPSEEELKLRRLGIAPIPADDPHFNALVPEEQKMMRTLWKYQRDYIRQGKSELWGFAVGSSSPEYGKFARGFSSLAQRGLVHQDKKGLVYLSLKGLGYAQRNDDLLSEDGDVWTQFTAP
jgi:hypothetical protein